MRSGESNQQDLTKSRGARFRCRQCRPIRFVNHLKSALFCKLPEFFDDLAGRRRPNPIKIPTGRADLIEDAKKIVGSAGDGFRDRGQVWVWRVFSNGFRGDGENESEMLAQGQSIRGVGEQSFAELPWR